MADVFSAANYVEISDSEILDFSLSLIQPRWQYDTKATPEDYAYWVRVDELEINIKLLEMEKKIMSI